jgi:hypothetical protein
MADEVKAQGIYGFPPWVKYLVRGPPSSSSNTLTNLVFLLGDKYFKHVEDIIPFLPRGLRKNWRQSMTKGFRANWLMFCNVNKLGGEVPPAKAPSSWFSLKWLGPDLMPMTCNVKVISEFQRGPKNEDWEVFELKEEDVEKLNPRLEPSGLALQSPVIRKWSRWIVPTKVEDGRTEGGWPLRTMRVKGHEFRFWVDESTIPGAGKGVFMSARKLSSSSKEFKDDDVVDCGIYALHSPDHWKSESEYELNVIWTNGKCRDCAFDAAKPGRVLDITDDITGERCTAASGCIWTYVNENEESQEETVFASTDLCGAVYVVLNCKRLVNDGTATEIFYNFSKEHQRIRETTYQISDYKDRQDAEIKVVNDEASMFESVSEWDIERVGTCLSFVKNVHQRGKQVDQSKLPCDFLERFFSVVFALFKRVESTDSSRSEGNASVETSARRILNDVLRSYNGEYSPLFQNRISGEMLSRFFGGATGQELREHLEQLVQDLQTSPTRTDQSGQ